MQKSASSLSEWNGCQLCLPASASFNQFPSNACARELSASGSATNFKITTSTHKSYSYQLLSGSYPISFHGPGFKEDLPYIPVSHVSCLTSL